MKILMVTYETHNRTGAAYNYNGLNLLEKITEDVANYFNFKEPQYEINVKNIANFC